MKIKNINKIFFEGLRYKIIKSIRENKIAVLIVIALFIFFDLFIINNNSDWYTFFILFLSVLSIHVYAIKSREILKFALLLLFFIFVSFILTKTSQITEKMSVLWFFFIILGTLKQWKELTIVKNNVNTTENIYMNVIKKFSLIIYSVFGPVVSFKLAMSPLGRIIFKMVLRGKSTIEFKTKYNFKMSLNSYEYLMSGYFFMGETNPYETKALRNKLKSGDTFIDVGTHIGWYSLNAAQVVGEKGNILAFEPNKECIISFEKNIKLNNFNNILLEKIALSDKEGFFDFWIGDDMGGSFIKANTERLTINKKLRKEKVKTTTLDEYCKAGSIKNISLIKIDVEGEEMQVLYGAKKTLKKFSPDLIIEVVDATLGKNKSSKRELLNFLLKLGYKPFAFKSSGLIPYKIGDMQKTCNLYFVKSKNE